MILALACGANAQVLWSSAGGSAWLTGGNWTGAAVPTGIQIAQFATNPTAGSGVGINFGNPTNNGTRNQIVGAIEITSARAAAMIVGNSSGTAGNTGVLTLGGITVNAIANVILRNNSNQSFTIQNVQASGASTMNVALNNATNNIVNIDGTGGITISSIISGVSRMLTKAGAGSGVLTLSGANTYTGGTTITAGILSCGAINTIPSTGTMTLNGGTFRSGAAAGR